MMVEEWLSCAKFAAYKQALIKVKLHVCSDKQIACESSQSTSGAPSAQKAVPPDNNFVTLLIKSRGGP